MLDEDYRVYTPAVGDLNRDGDLEIVAATANGRVHAFELDGTPVTGSWPVGGGEPTTIEPSSAPALGDIDSDGYLEVVIGSSTMEVWAYNHDGSVVTGWPKSAMDPVFGTPALGDMDGDGDLEVVAGDTTGFVWAWNGDGSAVSTWPEEPQFDKGAITSSPALADIDSDGKQEIIATTFRYDQNQGWILALNEDGSYLSGWPINYPYARIYSSPAVGDVDGNGIPDIVVLFNDGKLDCRTPAGTRTSGWPVPLPDTATNTLPLDYSYRASSPVLADVDGDGNLEIIVGSYDGAVDIRNNDGTELDGWPKITVSPVRVVASVGNMDADGLWDIVIGSDDGAVYRYEVAGNTATKPANLFPWPTFHGDNQRSGSFRILGQDSFTRTDWTGWGTADFGGPWTCLNCATGNPWTEPWIYADGSHGCIEPGFGGLPQGICILTQTAADVDMTAQLGVVEPGGTSAIIARVNGSDTFYAATWSPTDTQFRLEKCVDGVTTVLASENAPYVADRMVRLRVEGNTIKAKQWQPGTAEPVGWSLSAPDNDPLPAGKAGFWTSSEEMLYFFDNFLAEILSR